MTSANRSGIDAVLTAKIGDCPKEQLAAACFLRTIEATLIDPTWATPVTRSTGYAFAAIFYFLCCWGMSRYSIAVEKRLAAGQKR